MARRRMRRKTQRRRSRSGFNLVNALELYVQTDVITRNVMGTNPFTALTGMEQFNKQVGTGTGSKGQMVPMYSSQPSYGYNPSGASVTLPELAGLGSATVGQGIDTIKANFQANLFPMLIQSIGVRAGFAIGKKLMSKQRSFINNKMLKPLGLKSVVTV
jgi:hypothetical protein